jgi:hypothetical protein
MARRPFTACATASTILNEHDFNKDWIEFQLAHITGRGPHV